MKKITIILLLLFCAHFSVFADDLSCKNDTQDLYALFTPKIIKCDTNQFLPANSISCVNCPPGYTCYGGEVVFDEYKSSGIDYTKKILSSADNACAANFPDQMFAIYTPNIHDCEPGYYLPANVDACTQCLDGYYCPGGTYTFNEYNDQGLSPCPDGFINSDIGAHGDTQCYMECDPANLNIDYAVEFSGKDYYGTGIDTCVATKCASGYRVDNGICVENTININWNPDNGYDTFQSACDYNQEITMPEDPVRPGYTFTGWKLVE